MPGIGTGGGFKMLCPGPRRRGFAALEGAAGRLPERRTRRPGVDPGLYAVQHPHAPALRRYRPHKGGDAGRADSQVFETLSDYMGSAYINDFNLFGRTYQVTAQADDPFRLSPRDVADLKPGMRPVDMVPIGSVATFRDTTGPFRVARYNLYPGGRGAASISAAASRPGKASRRWKSSRRNACRRVSASNGPRSRLQEKLAGNTAFMAFGLAVVFVFLLLAALYESWLLPLAVILIVPMCILAAMVGVVNIRGLDHNILAEIGLVVLVGLAAKNAILIVEFAKQAEAEGMSRWDAAVAAARTRLRPILMTSFAFILGVVPLVVATGAGAEMRQSLGTAVFAGMLGVTGFGLLFTPAFYVMVRRLVSRGR